MNNYHIYEEIGRGKSSVVYKGRKKKSIEYVAIKSVDKSCHARIQNQVRVLHAMHCEAVMRFYTWYETNNHIWLILEYCGGGDLATLMKQDTKLPEKSIRIFALSLLNGLSYIHENGVLYADLKPSNILFDEAGTLKLCDFGLARQIKEVRSGGSMEKKGSPCYMAPELFSEAGVHSYASDLWSLGCVLYEMAAGRPPFVSGSLNQLVTFILSSPVPPLKSCSPQFNDLLFRLLDKDPSRRLPWSDLVSHEFFAEGGATVPAPRNLHRQPAFEEFVATHCRPATGPKSLHETPPPKPQSSRRSRTTPSPPAGRESGADQLAAAVTGSESARGSGGVDLLRLSVCARKNIEEDGYHAEAGEAADGTVDVALQNYDAELDFTEHSRDHDVEGAPGEGHRRTDDDLPKKLQDAPRSRDHSPDNFHEDERTPSRERERGRSSSPSAHDPPSTEPRFDDGPPHSRTVHVKVSSESRPSSAPVEDQVATAQRRSSLSMESRPESAADTRARRGSDTPGVPQLTSLSNPKPLADLIFHASDRVVAPIVGNKRIEKISEATYEEASLPFKALRPEEIVKLSDDALEAFLKQVYSALKSQSSIAERQNVLAYFEALSTSSLSANLLVDSAFFSLLVKLVHPSRQPALPSHMRARMLTVAGFLVRYATFISPRMLNGDLLIKITEAGREKDVPVRRRATATIGEILFYLATQPDMASEAVKKGTELNTGVQRAMGYLRMCCREGEDPVNVHYAAKTIENVAAYSPEFVEMFASAQQPQGALHLLEFAKNARLEQQRSCALSAVFRVSRVCHGLIASLLAQGGVKWIIQGLDDNNIKSQQCYLNLFSLALLDGSARVHSSFAANEKTVTKHLAALLDHSSLIIKGKCLVAMALFTKIDNRWLQLACDTKIIPTIDRLIRTERDEHLRGCLAGCVALMADILPKIAVLTSAELSGRRGSKAGVTSHTTTATQGLKVLVNFMTHAALRSHVLTAPLVEQIANLLTISETSGREDAKRDAMLLAEALSSHSYALVANFTPVIEKFVPALLALYTAPKTSVDTRFMSMKVTVDVFLQLLSHPAIYPAPAGSPPFTVQATTAINNIFVNVIQPQMDTILQDDDPIPTMGLKLMSQLVQRDSSLVAGLVDAGIHIRLFSFLEIDHVNNNIHNLKLLLALVEYSNLDPATYVKYDIVRRLGLIVKYVEEREIELFLEPVMELAASFADAAFHSAPSSTRGEGHVTMHSVAKDLLPLSLVFARVLSYPDPSLQELATKTMLTLYDTYGTEARSYLFSSETTREVRKALMGWQSGTFSSTGSDPRERLLALYQDLR
eukprot:Rmarinus@m.7566